MAKLYGDILQKIRVDKGYSQNHLAKMAGVHSSYINRLESGERDVPSQEIHMVLVQTLRPSFEDNQELSYAAGYIPPALKKVGPNNPAIRSVLKVLSSSIMSQGEKDAFCFSVQKMAEEWQRQKTANTEMAVAVA
jgi:predicted transcriptional regulator